MACRASAFPVQVKRSNCVWIYKTGASPKSVVFFLKIENLEKTVGKTAKAIANFFSFPNGMSLECAQGESE